MSYIVSIFNEQSDLDDALKELYTNEFGDDQVVIMRNAADYGDGAVERTDVGNRPTPIVAYAHPSNGTTPAMGTAVAAGEIVAGDLDVTDEAMEFYREQADDGAVVVFVETDDDEADEVYTMMSKHNPARVDRIEA